jgi:hypothetical protein
MEIATLLNLSGSDHWSWRRSETSPTWRQTHPMRSAAPLLTTGITPHHVQRTGTLLLLTLQPIDTFTSLSPHGHASEAVTRDGREIRRGGKKESLPAARLVRA